MTPVTREELLKCVEAVREHEAYMVDSGTVMRYLDIAFCELEIIRNGHPKD